MEIAGCDGINQFILKIWAFWYIICLCSEQKGHQYFFCGKYDLIQLHSYTSKWWDIHEKFIETITTSIFYLKFKENNENDMAAHEIGFVFYYRPKPSQIGPNGSTADTGARLDVQNNLL